MAQGTLKVSTLFRCTRCDWQHVVTGSGRATMERVTFTLDEASGLLVRDHYYIKHGIDQ